MPGSGTSWDVRVSVQARGTEDAPWNGHLAAGVLIDTDQILVPEPDSALLDAEQEFEALIFSTPLDMRNPIDRIRPRQVEISWLEGREDRPLAAAIRLAGSSRHLPMFGRVNGCKLTEVLGEVGYNLWMALEAMALIPSGVHEPPSEEVFRTLAEYERAQRQPWRRTHVNPPTRCYLICCILPGCEPCPPY